MYVLKQSNHFKQSNHPRRVLVISCSLAPLLRSRLTVTPGGHRYSQKLCYIFVAAKWWSAKARICYAETFSPHVKSLANGDISDETPPELDELGHYIWGTRSVCRWHKVWFTVEWSHVDRCSLYCAHTSVSAPFYLVVCPEPVEYFKQ